ncbi:MAG: STAS/SEC14 domain-containing protein [Pseudomonadota bacterium]|nr:STAS/SEC14 domain-containing protein [Pseudomonadota bacterium]
MFTETLTDRDDAIGIVCEGKLSQADLKRMRALLHERLETASGSPSLLVDITEFEGYEGPATLAEDLKINTAHRNDFNRIASWGSGSGCRGAYRSPATSHAPRCAGLTPSRQRRPQTQSGQAAARS